METRQADAQHGMRAGSRVDCATKTATASPHHRIQAIGGLGRDGVRWRLSEQAAMDAIDNERAAFYLEWPAGHRVNIVIAQGLGKRYLKAESDGESPDRLLALPECG